ncbi:MAG: carboxylating nicotinate-nucleotide diphosphorylase [Ignisphaera sp.]
MEIVFRRFLDFIYEDNPFWDLTTEALVSENINVKAAIVAREDGLVACVEDVASILRRLGLSVKIVVGDGGYVKKGDIVMEITGNARTVLSIERTMLNLLMHCSGIATTVRRLVNRVREVNSRVRVAATRKTLPGLRYFEKKAVLIGGGDTHRLSLSDAILIKDNHIKIVGDVAKAVRIAREKKSFIHEIEVEVTNASDAIAAAEAGANIIMFDNMTPEEVRRAIEELRKRGLRDRVLIEVSGGITEDNIIDYAKLDVDIISCGWITLSSKALDMSLEIIEVLEK